MVKFRLGNILAVGYNNLSTTVDGQITGAGGSLVKVGAGKLTLTGHNIYTDLTIIAGGTLELGPGGSLASDIVFDVGSVSHLSTRLELTTGDGGAIFELPPSLHSGYVSQVSGGPTLKLDVGRGLHGPDRWLRSR